MKKNYSLILLAFLCAVMSCYGQIITFDFIGLTGSEATATSNFNDPNLSSSTISRGAGLIASNNGNRFNANNWALNDIATAISGNDYMEFTITPNATYEFDVTTINVNFQRSSTGVRGILLRSSLDGYTSDIDTEKVIADITSVQTITFNVGQTNNTSAVTYRIYGWAERTGGTGGFEGTGDDIVVNGSVSSSCTPPADPNGTITGTTPACTSTTLTYTGTDTTPLLLLNYWQTSPTGTDQTNDAVSTYNATATGTYYIRKYDVVADCWSDNTVSYAVVIDTASPTISVQPTDQAVIIPNTATFSVTSSGASLYQWEVSTNGGTTWNSVVGGSGANTDTYITGATSLAMDGNLYRCILTNACGSVTANAAFLSASNIADVVITEIMYNTTGTDDEWIEICNVSGSSQSLNNYTIEVGSATEFTFPSSGVVLADGDCITIALGDGGGADFNPDCPFTPDYTNGAGTGTLNNTSDTISLIASDGTTTVDEVTYDDGDGADGDGNSLHVVDTSLDNSFTNTNYWEVLNGGSPGTNSLISPCTPVGPEINVEGNTGNFPDISNMDVTPSTFDGTDFGDLNVGSTLINEFRIENFGGTQDLTIASVTILSGDTGDFAITSLPASPIASADPNGFSIFEIQFQPTNDGVRTAVIQIVSNDGDENPYTFTVTGNGLCVASSITASPDSGPEGTIVTVTGTNLTSATASFNGVTAVVNNISASEMEVIVPSGATSGNLEIIDDLGCPGITSFTVIDSEISSCEGSGGTIPTDLFISELTDATRGGLTYIELFNGTGSAINIDDYSIEAIYNGDATALATNILDLENTTIANGDTYVIAIGRLTPVDNTNACTSVTGGSGELASSANAQFTSGGINKKTDEHDVIRLMHMGVVVDEFGVYQDSDWMDSTIITGDRGFNFRRSNTATVLPDPTFTLAELGNWEVIDWVGSGTSSCNTNDYSNIGLFDFSTGTAPIVNSISSSTTSCNEATISVSANEGSSGGNALEYYWFAYDPSNAGLGWQAISDGGIYTTSAASPNLIITDAESVSDFQFYCEVREDDATCYTASNAISIIISQATWDGMNWVWNDGTSSGTLPTISTNVVLAANYSTANAGLQQSFSACNLTLNDNVTLTINNEHYVEVENNLDVNNTTSGGINIEPEGSFVQINDNGDVNADISTNLTVSKLTAPSNNWYEYTYWSSPVFEETPAIGLAASNPNRRFQYNAQYYRDSTFENNNDDTTSAGAGIDDVDDQAPYDWGNISTTYLVPGVGYASTHDPIVFGSTPNCPGPTCRIRYTFSGLFNNGVITVPLFRNDSELDDNNWNLIGNPYPSAIDADVFLNTNMGVIDESIPEPNPIVEGAIYLWSQNTAPSNTTNGNENINFSQSDYAIINGTGQTAAQNNGGDSTIPTRHIPSGQAFFIVMDDTATSTQVSPSPVSGEDIQTANVIFNNAMRVTGNNNQFFRTSTPKDKVWINLTTDNGSFSQILVGYIENATNDYDGMYFDAPKNGSVDSNTAIYTRIDGIEKGFAIQGKSLSSLSIDEIIPVGFNTSISEPTIYTFSIPQIEGPFMNQNEIFVVDKLLNTIHNLKQSDYAFTSDLGTFEDRFDIVFRADALSIDDSILDANELKITELSEKEVQIKVGANHTISNVEILDVLGRIIYSFNGNSSIEVYDISKLSKAAYIAKVTLTSGQTISKKAIKRL